MSTTTLKAGTAPLARTQPITGIPFARLVHVELRKQLDTRAGRWLLIALGLVTALVMVVRFSEGRPVSQGGRDHSSHRLVYNGLGERRAVAVLLALTVNCTAAAVALVIFQDALLTALVAGATFAGLLAFASQLVVVAERPGRVAGFAAASFEEVEAHRAAEVEEPAKAV